MGVDGEPQDTQARVEVVLPDRRVPLGRAALEHLGTPDVVDEHVDVAVPLAELVGQTRDLVGVEVVDRGSDPDAAELRDDLGRLLDGLGPVVVRPG